MAGGASALEFLGVSAQVLRDLHLCPFADFMREMMTCLAQPMMYFAV
jgi:hypothetical protein